jgi:glutathione reductase (NADPH)
MEQRLAYRINQGTTNKWPSSLRIGEQHGYYKVLIDTNSDEILGAHIVRHNAEEVINIFALAIKHHIKAHELAEFMWAYPTYTSDLKYMVR